MRFSKVFFELSNCLEPQLRTIISFKPGSFVFFTPFRVSGYPGRAASCRKPLRSFSSFLESVCFWPFSFQSWSRLSHQIPARFGHAPRGSLRIALSKALFSFPTFWNVISHIRLPSDPPRSKLKRIARTARPKSLSHPPPPSCHKNPRICRNLLAQFSNFLECCFSFCPRRLHRSWMSLSTAPFVPGDCAARLHSSPAKSGVVEIPFLIF